MLCKLLDIHFRVDSNPIVPTIFNGLAGLAIRLQSVQLCSKNGLFSTLNFSCAGLLWPVCWMTSKITKQAAFTVNRLFRGVVNFHSANSSKLDSKSIVAETRINPRIAIDLAMGSGFEINMAKRAGVPGDVGTWIGHKDLS